jgi:hypothetical protein
MKTDFYVNDLLTECRIIEKAKQLQKELVSMRQRGGFNLQKWSLNAKTGFEADEHHPTVYLAKPSNRLV